MMQQQQISAILEAVSTWVPISKYGADTSLLSPGLDSERCDVCENGSNIEDATHEGGMVKDGSVSCILVKAVRVAHCSSRD